MQYEFSKHTVERVAKMQILKNQQLNKNALESKLETVQKQQTHLLAASKSTKQVQYNMQTAAKMLGIGPKKLFKILRQKHIFETNVNNTPYQRYIAAGYFTTELKSRMQQGVGQVFYAKTRVTNKGIIWLKNKLQLWEEKNV